MDFFHTKDTSHLLILLVVLFLAASLLYHSLVIFDRLTVLEKAVLRNIETLEDIVEVINALSQGEYDWWRLCPSEDLIS